MVCGLPPVRNTDCDVLTDVRVCVVHSNLASLYSTTSVLFIRMMRARTVFKLRTYASGCQQLRSRHRVSKPLAKSVRQHGLGNGGNAPDMQMNGLLYRWNRMVVRSEATTSSDLGGCSAEESEVIQDELVMVLIHRALTVSFCRERCREKYHGV